MPDQHEKTFFPGQSWEIDLRGNARDVCEQVRGLVRVPHSFKNALASEIVALWPDGTDTGTSETKLITVKIFARIHKTATRDKSEKRELHINGSITEL